MYYFLFLCTIFCKDYFFYLSFRRVNLESCSGILRPVMFADKNFVSGVTIQMKAADQYFL